MAEQTSSGSDMDVEKARNESENDDVDKAQHDSDKEDVEKHRRDSDRDSYDSDESSILSERHAEGPASLRSPSVGRSQTNLSRTTSRRLEQVSTTATNALSTIRSRHPRQTQAFTHPLTHEKTAADVRVDFTGPDDPYRPINWPTRKKIMTTGLYGLTTMTATLASSIFSPTTEQISKEFHVGTEVATLGTALFLFGFGVGPLIWAPISEIYGRKPAVILPVFIAGLFAFGVGAGDNIQTVTICRFFQGFFGSAPVTNTGGVLGDLFSPKQRGAAVVGYSMAVVGGPTIGPIIGGAITMSHLRWRWTQYISGIFTMLMVVVDVLCVDESYPAALLVAKARRLRIESGNWALHAKHEEWNVTLLEMAHKYLIRPFQLLATPICFLMSVYGAFCYGILYATLGAFPIEYQEIRGWNAVVGALPFLSMLIGVLFGAVANLINQSFYIKAMAKNGGRPVPEARLPPMMVGSVMFAAGLFTFAWTSDKHFPWIAPTIGVAMTGFGFFTIFQACTNYLIDTFQRYSASAVAASTFLRSCFAGAFSLFISIELHAIGIGWGMSVFAFVACLLLPIPFLFYIYGKRIRAKGVWSRESTL